MVIRRFCWVRSVVFMFWRTYEADLIWDGQERAWLLPVGDEFCGSR